MSLLMYRTVYYFVVYYSVVLLLMYRTVYYFVVYYSVVLLLMYRTVYYFHFMTNTFGKGINPLIPPPAMC